MDILSNGIDEHLNRERPRRRTHLNQYGRCVFSSILKVVRRRNGTILLSVPLITLSILSYLSTPSSSHITSLVHRNKVPALARTRCTISPLSSSQ